RAGSAGSAGSAGCHVHALLAPSAAGRGLASGARASSSTAFVGVALLLPVIALVAARARCRTSGRQAVRQLRAVKKRAPSTKTGSEPTETALDDAGAARAGYISRMGKDGVVHLPPAVQHMVRISAAGVVAGLPVAPSAHREGYADPQARGPRFSLLPPPVDLPLSNKDGACQPALVSRLDASKDIRLGGKVGKEYPPTADSINLVPSPYCHAIRPDQRVRAAAAAGGEGFEDLTRTLEKQLRWFPTESKEAMEGEWVSWTDEELRKQCSNRGKLVSGNRRALLSRYAKDNSPTAMSQSELAAECKRLGMEVK
ncbi:unnamed protein product, partial [Polarella glacialis]